MWMDRGLKHPPEDEQKRDRRDTNGQCSKPIHHALSAPRSSLGVSLLPSLKEVLARNAARPVSRQRKKYRSGWLPTHVQLQRDFAPPKGGERPAALTPQRGLAGWRRTKLRLAAGRLLVALGRVRVLFLCAKHLFVAARRGPPRCRCAFQVSAGGLLLVAVNHEKGEPDKHSEALRLHI